MRILIVYFSGTGNTKRISVLMQREFISGGADCRIVAMEDYCLQRLELDLSGIDLVGIGFPVHAMDAPQIVYDFLELLPKKAQNYFLFKTAGSAFIQAGSTRQIRHHLAMMGWKLVYEQLFEMPPNAFGTAKPEKVLARYNKCSALVSLSTLDILSGNRHRIREAPLVDLCYAFARLEKYGARQSSRRWYANAKCNLCGLCVSQCPAQNIRIEDGKLVFADKCLLCLRCWWICPRRAISHKLLGFAFLKEPYSLPDIE